ncbi:hypothetical protein ECANGB1_2724 [Enterospora canceri]|uniref:Secreted protein n=1 Tax=Enterospora canceri TaxID=1081671 RepID=A0A1Y1S4V0_9MICR|nr:hypothetical protein ECANGB1_2724 [Enterospora canceri]
MNLLNFLVISASLPLSQPTSSILFTKTTSFPTEDDARSSLRCSRVCPPRKPASNSPDRAETTRIPTSARDDPSIISPT